MPWSHSGWGRIDISDALGRPYPPLQSTPIYSDNNILQMVVWESFFFNQGIACLEIAQLWAVLVKCWLSSDCNFNGFSTSQIGWNGVAVTVQSHRRYGAIAMPLRCNRDAVTVQSRCRYGLTAMVFGKKAANGAAKGHLEAIFPLYLTLFPSVKFWQ